MASGAQRDFKQRTLGMKGRKWDVFIRRDCDGRREEVEEKGSAGTRKEVEKRIEAIAEIEMNKLGDKI